MGGKTWQQDEEELFWLELIPRSPEGLDPALREYSWKEIAEVMHRRLGEKGYRNYNHQLIYEHFYQNCKSNHPSPRARNFVREYMERRGDEPIERPEKPKSKLKVVLKRRAASDDAVPSETKRARPDSEDVLQEYEHLTMHDAPHHPPPYPLPRYGLDVAHAASQTTGYDGTAMEDYWPCRRPLPFAPRPDYYVACQPRRESASYYSEPSTPIDAQHRPSTHHRDSVSTSSGSEANHYNGRKSSVQHAYRPVSLPPVTLEPRIGSLSNANYRTSDTRVALPPISVLTSVADAGRHPRRPELTSPSNHSSKWEALLNAASASSAEVSPNSIISRSELFSRSQPESPVATVPDYNATEAEEPNNGKLIPGPARTEEQSAMTE